MRNKKRLLTKPKRNADFRAKLKGLCIFIKALNWKLRVSEIFKFSFGQEKKKQNPPVPKARSGGQ